MTNAPERRAAAGMQPHDLTLTLVESFNALADEVQSLSDRQTILEHKLRYAHEQFQYLADKYAPAAPEISETVANLQLPAEVHHPSLAHTNFVPLPRRQHSDAKQQIALIIREGRRVASSLTGFSKSSRSSRDTRPPSPTTMPTSASTILEQDFTVAGKKGDLRCPFSRPLSAEVEAPSNSMEDRGPDPDHDPDHGPDHGPTPHQPTDPICVAMLEEATSQTAAPSGSANASKCPIRYMNQHSPEEIAHYVKTHTHELPRNHEVCIRRYQKNEDDIRKLDAKYGNMAKMMEGLGKVHQPLLPEADTRPQSDVEKGSNERVQAWTQNVDSTLGDDPDRTASLLEDHHRDDGDGDDDDDGRQGHFDRPLKEVRVGESPSRPWGISVPIYGPPSFTHGDENRAESPPPAPVQMPAPPQAYPNVETPAAPAPKTPKAGGKCPFDHAKLMGGGGPTPLPTTMPKAEEEGKSPSTNTNGDAPSTQPFTPATPTQHHPPPPPPNGPSPQPAFLTADSLAPRPPGDGGPQMLFTGPVFIGYPIEQAIQFMQHFQGQQK